MTVLEGGAEAIPHQVERAGQLVELLAAADHVDGFIELHGTDSLGSLDQLLNGAAEEAASEINDEEVQQWTRAKKKKNI